MTSASSSAEALTAAWQRHGIARLSAIVAHDLNNLVQIVGGYAEILMSGVPDEAKRQAHLGQILSASKAGAHLATQLLRFSRPSVADVVVLDISLVVRALRALVLESAAPPTVELHLDPRPAFTRTHPDRLAADLISVVAAALADLPSDGRLIVTTVHDGDAVVVRCTAGAKRGVVGLAAADVVDGRVHEHRFPLAPDPAQESPA
jgi:signal transduction histidine kinase